MPEVIFTTAYNDYAIKAFDYNALDYLQKPIQADRLEQAIEKLVAKHRQISSAPVIAAKPEILKPDDRVFVKDGDFYWFVPISDIRLLEVDGSYTRIRFERNNFV